MLTKRARILCRADRPMFRASLCQLTLCQYVLFLTTVIFRFISLSISAPHRTLGREDEQNKVKRQVICSTIRKKQLFENEANREDIKYPNPFPLMRHSDCILCYLVVVYRILVVIDTIALLRTTVKTAQQIDQSNLTKPH